MYKTSREQLEEVLYALETLTHVSADRLVDTKDEDLVDRALEVMRNIIESGDTEQGEVHAEEQVNEDRNEAPMESENVETQGAEEAVEPVTEEA